MLRAVDGTHLHVLAMLPDLFHVLSPLEAVEQVVAQRLVEVETKSSRDFGGEATGGEVSKAEAEGLQKMRRTVVDPGPRSGGTCSIRRGSCRRWERVVEGRAARQGMASASPQATTRLEDGHTV